MQASFAAMHVRNLRRNAAGYASRYSGLGWKVVLLGQKRFVGRRGRQEEPEVVFLEARHAFLEDGGVLPREILECGGQGEDILGAAFLGDLAMGC